jgi:hypothetical protein
MAPPRCVCTRARRPRGRDNASAFPRPRAPGEAARICGSSSLERMMMNTPLSTLPNDASVRDGTTPRNECRRLAVASVGGRREGLQSGNECRRLAVASVGGRREGLQSGVVSSRVTNARPCTTANLTKAIVLDCDTAATGDPLDFHRRTDSASPSDNSRWSKTRWGGQSPASESWPPC